MKLHKILPALALVALTTACSSDYLDTVETPYITQKQKDELTNDPAALPRVIKAELQAVYQTFQIQDLESNTRHDYFGLKSVHLATDLMGEDMVQVKHHYFGFDYNLDNREAPYARTRYFWALFYKIVASSNDFIVKYLSDDSKMTPELATVKAELLTLRGLSYYYLVNLYQQTYKGNEQALGVPLALPGSPKLQPRATVEEVYKQIVEDLTYGVENGQVTDDHADADKRVAAAFLAKTYAAMEDWANTEKYARTAVAGVSVGFPSNLSKVDNDDVLWGCEVNDQNSTIYASFFSHIDTSIKGYAGLLGIHKAIHNKLYEQISDNDARKEWWRKKDLATMKFKSPADFTGDYIYLRSADPYLLYVEALGEQGKLTDAAAALKSFLASRGAADQVDQHVTDVADFRGFLQLQRRIELWGEGTSLFDTKRWKLPVDRTVEGTNHRTKVKLEAGSKEFVYQIPQREMDQNNLLEQNP